MKSYSPSSLETPIATASPPAFYFSGTQSSIQKSSQSSMTVPYSELLTSQTSDSFFSDTHEAIEERSEKEVRMKLLNLGIDDVKVYVDHDERVREGGLLSDHNQKASTMKIVR